MLDRRQFVKRTCLGGLALYLDHWATSPAYGQVLIPPAPPIYVNEPAGAGRSRLGMPGRFPGRVVEVSDSSAILSNRVSQPVIERMLDRALRELTGARDRAEAWSQFVEPGDIVGIKINPSGAPACCSSPEIVREIVSGVHSAGVPLRNIRVYDRYAYEIDIGSYQTLVPLGVRVIGVEDRKLAATGYDSNIYCEANFFGEWETRSYMASIVSSDLTKIINVPTMKDHSAAGVTGCLKNLGYGTFNNVDRSHRRPFSFTDPLIGVMCSAEPLRSKAVLHVMDGMRMLWHGGPLSQNPRFIFPAGILMVGTDPVAMDSIELEKIEAKRRAEKAPSVWSRDPKSLTENGGEFYEDSTKNLYYRQPHHIAAAGKLGLGISDLKQIDHRVLGPS
ncbi:MAG TPA: DUF362 domain-containing protein [Candidatus Acidoferrum sp.]|nr:DUF362 domain-containing protein [Candidatus Acidoferrum sp.]